MLRSRACRIRSGAIPLGGQPRWGDSLGEPIQLAASSTFTRPSRCARGRARPKTLLLHILYPQKCLREARWQAAYPPLVGRHVLLGVVIVLAMAIAGRLSRPILELRRELGRLVQGDFEPMPLPERNDELRDLIGSVNVLGDQLDELRRVDQAIRAAGACWVNSAAGWHINCATA